MTDSDRPLPGGARPRDHRRGPELRADVCGPDAQGQDRPAGCARPGRGVPARRLPPPRPSAPRSPAACGRPLAGPGRPRPHAHALHLRHPSPAPPARLPRPLRQCGAFCPPGSKPPPAGPLRGPSNSAAPPAVSRRATTGSGSRGAGRRPTRPSAPRKSDIDPSFLHEGTPSWWCRSPSSCHERRPAGPAGIQAGIARRPDVTIARW